MTTTEGLDERGMERMGSAERHEMQADWKDESAKLRELVQSLYRFSFDEYPDGTESNFAERLRELGIEVPEQ